MFFVFAGVRLPVLPEVCVHRLITEGTYEEQLEKIMARKQDLSSLTVGGPLLRLERGGYWEYEKRMGLLVLQSTFFWSSFGQDDMTTRPEILAEVYYRA